MDEETRRKLELGRRALEFARAHPDANPKYAAAVARLEALLARAAELERQEEEERKLAGFGKVLPFGRRFRGGPPEPAA